MFKKLGFKKILIIAISLITAIGAVVGSVILITKNNTAQSGNDDNRDNADPLSPINRGVELIFGEGKITEYYIGDEFVAPVIFARFNDGKINNVSSSNNLTISGYDLSKAGLQIVNVEYTDNNIYGRLSYKIYVINAKPVSLNAYYLDEDILWGEQLDHKKIVATLTYSNKDERRINEYSLDYDYKPDSYGPNEAILTYNEFTTAFTVNVIKKEIDYKYSYLENEMKNLLTIIGFINPTCPKDYSFSIDTNGKGVFKNIM